MPEAILEGPHTYASKLDDVVVECNSVASTCACDCNPCLGALDSPPNEIGRFNDDKAYLFEFMIGLLLF